MNTESHRHFCLLLLLSYFCLSPIARADEYISPKMASTARVKAKLDTLQIAKLELDNATIAETVDALRRLAWEADRDQEETTRRGVPIALRVERFHVPDTNERHSVR